MKDQSRRAKPLETQKLAVQFTVQTDLHNKSLHSVRKTPCGWSLHSGSCLLRRRLPAVQRLLLHRQHSMCELRVPPALCGRHAPDALKQAAQKGRLERKAGPPPDPVRASRCGWGTSSRARVRPAAGTASSAAGRRSAEGQDIPEQHVSTDSVLRCGTALPLEALHKSAVNQLCSRPTVTQSRMSSRRMLLQQ